MSLHFNDLIASFLKNIHREKQLCSMYIGNSDSKNQFSIIIIGAELGGAAGARAPPLFTPRPEIIE